MRLKLLLLLLLLLHSKHLHSQIEKTIGTGVASKNNYVFKQFDIYLPYKINENYGEIDFSGQRSDNRLIPSGVSTNIGYGIHYKFLIGVSINSGVVFMANEKLVAIPLYANFRLSPKIMADYRLTLQYGLGQSTAIGRGSLSGKYQKFSIGIEGDSGYVLFAFAENHGFNTIHKHSTIQTVGLGLALYSF